jgi:hypothetical protein
MDKFAIGKLYAFHSSPVFHGLRGELIVHINNVATLYPHDSMFMVLAKRPTPGLYNRYHFVVLLSDGCMGEFHPLASDYFTELC